MLLGATKCHLKVVNDTLTQAMQHLQQELVWSIMNNGAEHYE